MNTTNINTNTNKTDRLISRITTIIAIIVVILLLIWGIKTLFHHFNYEETNDAQVDEYINPVVAKVTGYIQEIRYEENQEVKKGDTLVIIDNSEYAAQQQEAEASLLNAKAQVDILRTNVTTASQASKVNQSQIAAAKAKLVHQEQEYDRYKKLYDVESATKQQLERVEAALAVARSDYQTALDAYQASVARINDTRVQQEALEAEIKRREAVVTKNNLNVSYTIITAPYNGKMGRRTVQRGQLIQAGQVIAYIVDWESGKWVVANFKETQIRHMAIGETAHITIDAFPGQTFTGKIESLAGATGSRFSLLPPDNATGNFVKIAQRIPVRIRLNGKPEELKALAAGMNANVSVSKE
ncbi:membrane fusion protein, multidrug efflux system [Chitinophaga terrae (ex Kim and Jung 2007)]|uniref:Membrane fusion protein, multidrug efflux system n=1 Tax=Chitinophaga terrae (ex Kim and Jung 2007) TaxID=408074 RepID=A0A1H4B7E5_9BACT|nr:HlyD family secretion protein [Chitinophaga terrae (ex Kim and Jung 2007)]MDQ0106326.1 membrane fusion protein (multidrug efflux system) [Chitinophaga terrae (ex Kim and Jung 2007)]GEP91208.1 multidrug resistance protein [Chitinophaga terrae (ex Kim and Jung 2007)]SEA44026.1 membrane fusion protein, multidrug efflux system [Chitinophaga terrae (ex Kim and Jung 2007)]